MKCPTCGGLLLKIEHANVEVDRCTNCKGIWFDTFEHEELRELSGSEVIDVGQPRATPAQGGSGLCPRDQQPLFGMVVAGQPHISYEACGVCHGVFFDASEFRDFREVTFGEKLRATFNVARAAQPKV